MQISNPLSTNGLDIFLKIQTLRFKIIEQTKTSHKIFRTDLEFVIKYDDMILQIN